MKLHFGPATEGELIIVTDARPSLRREALDVIENVKDSVLAKLSSGMPHTDQSIPQDRFSLIEEARSDLRKLRPEGFGEQLEMDQLAEPFLSFTTENQKDVLC